MNVKELKKAISEIEDICEAAGAKKAASDLEELLQLFEGHEDESVASFLKNLRQLYVPAKESSKPSDPADQQVVRNYSQKLREAASDQDAFSRVFAAMTGDKAVRKQEANEIQHAYIGGREQWPSRSAALKAIEKWFHGSRYQESVLEDIKKVTPW